MESEKLLCQTDTNSVTRISSSFDVPISSYRNRKPHQVTAYESFRTWCMIGLLILALTSVMALAVMTSRVYALESQWMAAEREAGVPGLVRSQTKTVVVQPDPDAWKDPTYVGEPSHESELAWNRLQQVRGVWINSDEARISNIEGLRGPHNTTAAVLGVMHNIHCIMLYPDHFYPSKTREERKNLVMHAGHCLESIRQSVMCNPDLAPRAAFWEDDEHSNIALNPSAKQVCMDWSSLVDWERSRSYTLDDLWAANPF